MASDSTRTDFLFSGCLRVQRISWKIFSRVSLNPRRFKSPVSSSLSSSPFNLRISFFNREREVLFFWFFMPRRKSPCLTCILSQQSHEENRRMLDCSIITRNDFLNMAEKKYFLQFREHLYWVSKTDHYPALSLLLTEKT